MGYVLHLRSSTSLPFWEGLLQLVSNSSVETPTLLQKVRRHNSQTPTLEKLSRRYVRNDVLIEKIKELKTGEVLAISSRVECIRPIQFMHLPMLDFHCKTSSSNDRLVRAVVLSLNLHGYIAHSGQSYHFYGSKLVDTQNLQAILSNALLVSPIVDRAWLAHQMIEGACGLRISPGKSYSACPTIVDHI